MPYATYRKMPKTTAPSIGVTDSGLAYVEVPTEPEALLTEEECDSFLHQQGFRTCTPQESERYRAFLRPQPKE